MQARTFDVKVEASAEASSKDNGTTGAVEQSRRAKRPGLGLLRALIVDIPLAVVFASFLLVLFFRHLYIEYYPRLLQQYRYSNEDLLDQYTYYHRYCTEDDLTTDDAGDLLVDTNAPVETAIDQLMTHGAVVIPEMLQPDTVRRLREYVVQRNHELKDEEEFPMYPPVNRLSYGFDATESPIVVKALEEVTNSAFFTDMMTQLLGDEDPASCELTTIAAFHTAEDQGWHSDTKEDGNALKFARSYSHTYSLFLALQNTTATMGATEVCPGTHMCANPMYEVCEANRMNLAGASPEGQLRAGDGALLSQIVWHRGAGHFEPEAPERIMFIITFLARPRHDKDSRQLARGTYFHQKWSQWGHTWKDLQDPMRSMQRPFSVLRALSIWKPSNYNWGYDMVTSIMMQLSNQMLHGDDLEKIVSVRMDSVGFPKWLRGPVKEQELSQREAWKIFWDETVKRTTLFVTATALLTHGVYLIIAVALAGVASRRGRNGWSTFNKSISRLKMTHGLIYLVVVLLYSRLRSSDWSKRVMKGNELMQPFPLAHITIDEELVMLPKGLTTFPAAEDVLIGSRFDAKWMGTFERYLDWHKGNIVYRGEISSRAALYGSYASLPATFRNRLVEDTLREIDEIRGRFLQQDYRTGNWHIMPEEAVVAKVQEDLLFNSIPVKHAVGRIIDREIADNRFGKLRETVMGVKASVYLHIVKNMLTEKRDAETTLPLPTKKRFFIAERIQTPRVSRQDFVPSFIRFSSPPESTLDPFRVGTKVWAGLQQRSMAVEYYRGAVVGVSDDGPSSYVVSFEDNERFEGLPADTLTVYVPVTEGDRVVGCFVEGFEDCYPGTVALVMPDASISILYDDGDFDKKRPRNFYYADPFIYFAAES